MKKFLAKIHQPKWLCFLLFIVLLLRIPSFFAAYAYGDEMIYLTLGNAIRHGIPLYSGIFDNKPPLLYLMAALAGNLFWFKTLLAFWNIATIIIFWNFTKSLFTGKEKTQKIATIIIAILTTLPLLEGHIVNAELFLICFTISAAWLFMSQKHDFRNLFVVGLLFSLATLFKMPAAFDIVAVVVFLFIQGFNEKEKFLGIIKKCLYLSLGFAVPLGISLIYFFVTGHLKDYVTAAFLQNIGYLSTFRPLDAGKSFLVRNLPLIIRGLIVVIASFLLFIKRKKISQPFLFVCLWLVFGLFAVTLSERPYPHYLIQVVPEISLLLAILFTERSLEQSLTVIPLALTFFIPFYYHYYYYPTASYYFRFLKLSSGIIKKEQYLASFGGNVVRNYNVANFLVASSAPNDKVWVIGDDASIYALSRRLPPIKFVADYHINDYSNMPAIVKEVEANKPAFIVLLPQKSLNITPVIPLLRKSYILVSEVDGAEIWKLRQIPRS
jgi:4-amino-4-deoxy-L-arabinose transferase-like glycosyltransferase